MNAYSGSGGSQISQPISSKLNNSNENNFMKSLTHSAKRGDTKMSKNSYVPSLDLKRMQTNHGGNRNTLVMSPTEMGMNDDLNASLRAPHETPLMSQQCQKYLRVHSKKRF